MALICGTSTIDTPLAGVSTARTNAAIICARLTSPSRNAISRVGGKRSMSQ